MRSAIGINPLQDTAAALAELDVLSNLAERALNLDLNCPRFVDEPNATSTKTRSLA